jgi:uncharacterized protein YkwD
MRRKLLYLFLMVSILTAALNLKVEPVKASTVSAGEMISMINNLRTGVYGLPALIEDTILDSTAYNTAQQMADSGECKHLGAA